jgi:hypothetical protein
MLHRQLSTVEEHRLDLSTRTIASIRRQRDLFHTAHAVIMPAY